MTEAPESLSPTKKLLRVVLVLVLLAGVSFKLLYKPDYSGTREPFERIEVDFAAARERALAGEFERSAAEIEADLIAERWQSNGVPMSVWEAETSQWLQQKKAAAAERLQTRDVSILVLPVQGTAYSLAPGERSLISRYVNHQIAKTTRVANHDDVVQYLGVNKKQFTEVEVAELAQLSGAESILALHVDHNTFEIWELSATLQNRATGAIENTQQWFHTTLAPGTPPSRSMPKFANDIAEFAVGSPAETDSPALRGSEPDLPFPPSADALLELGEQSPGARAAVLQFLGLLHPGAAYNEVRNSLFERSLIALLPLDPNSKQYKYFAARAYAALGQRPAAVSILGEPETPHQQALLAAINGNLPELQQITDGLDNSIIDFMAWRDRVELETIYEYPAHDVGADRFVIASHVWAPLLVRALQDPKKHKYFEPMTVAAGLEMIDIEVESRNSAFGELLSLFLHKANDKGVEATRRLLDEFDKLESELEGSGNRNAVDFVAASTRDFLDLGRATLIANHIAAIELEGNFRGRTQIALDIVDAYSSIYAGHPEVSLLQGELYSKLARSTDDAVLRRDLDKKAATAALNGFAWTGTSTKRSVHIALNFTHTFNRAAELHERLRVDTRQSERFYEWPRSPEWFTNITGTQTPPSVYEQCIDYSPTGFVCLNLYLQHRMGRGEEAAEVASDLFSRYADRFSGHPSRSFVDALVARATGGIDAVIQELRNQIATNPERWRNYKTLGQYLFRKGDFKEAQEVWLSYPGYDPNSGEDRVSKGSIAGNVGADLYWAGQYELAKPLLEIAAFRGGGSSMSYQSAERLALIDSDFREAAVWAKRRVDRYDATYGLRDLMQIYHAGGSSERAWTLFDEAKLTDPNMAVWSAAILGHRVEERSIADIAEWLDADERRKGSVNYWQNGATIIRPAARALLIAGTLDRVPNAEFADLVGAADFDNQAAYIPNSTRGRPEYVDEVARVAVVNWQGGNMHHDPLVPETLDEQRHERGYALDGRYKMLAAAMTAFLNDDCETAYRRFDTAAGYYRLDEYLPYHALCAAQLKRADHLIEVLRKREPQIDKATEKASYEYNAFGYRFNYDLSLAVLAAASEDHDAAIQHLRSALSHKPHLYNRSIYPFYQLVDVAERLYAQTGKLRYQSFAVDLARRHTVIQPMYAWAYFVVATHSIDETERVTAVASGLALDPLSYRATQLPADLLEKATSLLEKNGPPYLQVQRR